MAHRSTGEWGKQRAPEEWNQEFFDAGVKVNRYQSRVQDDEVRRLVDEIRSASITVATAQSARNGRSARSRMMAMLQPVNDRIGELLRSRY